MADLHTCYERIYAIVRRIPRGRVMTYGQIAHLVLDVCAGPVPAITVGRAMAASGRYDPTLPWWRVIGRAGDYGVLRSLPLSTEQRDLLAAEGVVADDEGRYDLARYLYEVEGTGE
jgi:methylated-DNA-protein-cysteine methyltransferase-like protein